MYTSHRILYHTRYYNNNNIIITYKVRKVVCYSFYIIYIRILYIRYTGCGRFFTIFFCVFFVYYYLFYRVSMTDIPYKYLLKLKSSERIQPTDYCVFVSLCISMRIYYYLSYQVTLLTFL